MRARLMFCAEGVLRDAETNFLSAWNILDEVLTPALPLQLDRVYVLAMLERAPVEPERCLCTLRIGLRELVLFEREVLVDFQGSLRQRTIVFIDGLLVPVEGIWQVQIRQREQVLASWEIAVSRAG
jgi:hypothetical protein